MWHAAPVLNLTSVLAALTAIVAVADWAVVARRRKDLETWLKPTTLALLIGTVIAAGALDGGVGVALVVALVLGLVGDVALLDETVEWRFITGLGAFLVGHLAYVACFVSIGWAGGWWLAAGAVLIGIALGVGRVGSILAGARREGGSGMVAPVVVYMLVIGVMTVSAWGTHSWWIAIGASVFMCSDTILANNKFVQPLSWAKPAIMVTYHVGQALIATGVLVRVAR